MIDSPIVHVVELKKKKASIKILPKKLCIYILDHIMVALHLIYVIYFLLQH